MRTLILLALVAAVAAGTWKQDPPSLVDKANAQTVEPSNVEKLVGSPAVVNSLAATVEYSLEAHNGVKWIRTQMIPALNSACFLTYTEYTGTQVGCEVFYDQSAGYWFLYAYSGASTAHSWCKSRCIQWS
eukprot:NODE_2389_length_581_cov_152.755507_g2339_i0.p1 GENE.NODE_2389_length_581_cov_152.755507_g2339_i0~~NODE_2389_length_581_cov_152.755507_g2339_i0.p1  ORF type:complete len:130 (-),score=34.16 NODE_2389_length_581_cov_152.755507_g2339_i0:113-502(-)